MVVDLQDGWWSKEANPTSLKGRDEIIGLLLGDDSGRHELCGGINDGENWDRMWFLAVLLDAGGWMNPHCVCLYSCVEAAASAQAALWHLWWWTVCIT